MTAVFEAAMDRFGRTGSGQVQNGRVVIEGDFTIQPSAGESTREQMGEAMWQLRRMSRGSASFRR